MERSPRKVKDRETDQVLNFVFENAMGNPIILNAVPTNAQMKANTWGIYGTTLYVKFANNVTLSFSGSNVA